MKTQRSGRDRTLSQTKTPHRVDGNRRNLTSPSPPTTTLRPDKPNEASTRLQIYADGACRPNPGSSGIGISVLKNRQVVLLEYGGFEQESTANRAELAAVVRALTIAESLTGPVTIYTDSKYARDATTRWPQRWIKKAPRRKTKKNLDLIWKSFQLYERLRDRVYVKYTKAPERGFGSQLAESLAKHAIGEQQHPITTMDSAEKRRFVDQAQQSYPKLDRRRKRKLKRKRKNKERSNQKTGVRHE